MVERVPRAWKIKGRTWHAHGLPGCPVGVRKTPLQEINEDAPIMWLDDIRTPECRSKLAGLMTTVPKAIRRPGSERRAPP
jgi:hypothetical protein